MATLFAVSLATGPVECHIRSLERSGALLRDPGLSQSDPLFLLGPRIRQRLSEAGDGEIRWRGTINDGRDKGIGLVPQGRRLFSSLTVTEHLSMLPGSHRSSWDRERVFAVFPRLEERRNHFGSQLSGGERQMLAIARALTLDPKLLLMDEPSEGLAPVLVQQLEQIIIQLKSTGLSILLVEQNLYSALAVAEDVYILETGRVVYHGTPAQLRDDGESMRRFLGVS
jgi:branched-chain amino acid transport system ATP-binding protein